MPGRKDRYMQESEPSLEFKGGVGVCHAQAIAIANFLTPHVNESRVQRLVTEEMASQTSFSVITIPQCTSS
jgi:hypothetical protein